MIFAWIYWDRGESSERLLYSMRSFHENFSSQFEPLIVGDCPDWYNGECIELSRQVSGSDFISCLTDYKAKILKLSQHVEGEFVIVNDDTFMLTSTGPEWFEGGAYYDGWLPKDNSNQWRRCRNRTAKMLKTRGKDSKNFSTHLPYKVSGSTCRNLFREMEGDRTPWLFESTYFNFFPFPTEKKIDGMQISRTAETDCRYVSFSKRGFGKKQQEIIKTRFKKANCYEK